MVKILIVDDEPSVRSLLTMIMEREGYEIFEAENGFTATELASSYKFDIIITDIFMPKKDGLEIIIEIKRDNPNVKIIAISGNQYFCDSKKYLNYAEKLGASFAFTKPISNNTIVDAVKSLVQ